MGLPSKQKSIPRRFSKAAIRWSKNVAYRQDFRRKPVGQLVGGKYGVIIECPKCGEGCVKLGTKVVQGTEQTQYCHCIEFYLDLKNNPVPEYSGLCVVEH